MTAINTNVVVMGDKAVKSAYAKAKLAESKAYGAFVGFIIEHAGMVCDANKAEAVSVATFAAFMGDDLNVGKEVSAEDKAERNRIRARIRYGLEQAGKLLEAKRKPAAAGSKGKGKGKTKSVGQEAADAVKGADDTAGSNPANRFSAVCSILRAMDRNELARVANEVATLLAAHGAAIMQAKRTKAG